MKVSYGLTFRYTAQNFKIFKIESKSLLTYFFTMEPSKYWTCESRGLLQTNKVKGFKTPNLHFKA